jgi:hypothetical protein
MIQYSTVHVLIPQRLNQRGAQRQRSALTTAVEMLPLPHAVRPLCHPGYGPCPPLLRSLSSSLT